jgi:hypothetical protein
LNGCRYFPVYLTVEPASACILQPKIAVLRGVFAETTRADSGQRNVESERAIWGTALEAFVAGGGSSVTTS